MKKVLTIAGSDPSGGAGIQADLKTMEAHGVYGMSVITALTAQNTLGVTGKLPVSGEFVRQQLQAVFDDIFPDAVKIGMLPDAEVMEAVRDELLKYSPKNIVLDPVLGSTSGTSLSAENSRSYLKEKLFPLCTLITPNIPEAEVLLRNSDSPETKKEEAIDSPENSKWTDFSIKSEADMEKAARKLGDTYRCSVLIKGGHGLFTGDICKDCLYSEGEITWFKSIRIDNPNTHGTGCTLSSAIACNLALGFSLSESVQRAKDYLTKCIDAGLDIGKGRGPLEHKIKV